MDDTNISWTDKSWNPRAAVRAQLVVAQTTITEALAIVDAGLASTAGARLEGVE